MSASRHLVVTYMQMLDALSGWLDKARESSSDPDGLLAARLAPDMLPLSSQVRFCCAQAYEAPSRLRGVPLPGIWHELVEEGWKAGDHPGTLADAKSVIAATRSFLKSLESSELDSEPDRIIELELPNGAIFDMTGTQYVRDWALPQFNFHLVTAYAILRNWGIPLGKADYVPHALAYLRPERR